MSEFNLKEKRKEAFDWVECMDKSGQSSDEIIEDLKDKIEKQDKEFLRRLKEEIENPTYPYANVIQLIDKLSGFEDD